LPSGIDINSDYLVKLESISKTYSVEGGLKIDVLQDINFKIDTSERGTITTILAPFGSGKSTLLKIIAGLIEPSGGKIFFKDDHHKIPYITEKPSSFPWLNVRKNIEVSMNLKTSKETDIQSLISLVDLAGYEDHFANNKSVGFRFRISLARALAVNPSLILIDDSFKVMKRESRGEIFDLLINISSRQNLNFVLATTNLVEAVQLSDKIILMSKKPGKIIKEIHLNNKDRTQLNNHNSEIFTTVKAEIETAFEAAESLTTINYSV